MTIFVLFLNVVTPTLILLKGIKQKTKNSITKDTLQKRVIVINSLFHTHSLIINITYTDKNLNTHLILTECSENIKFLDRKSFNDLLLLLRFCIILYLC